MMPRRPPRQVCPLCGSDDFVQLASTGPDLWEFRCVHGPQHANTEYVWSPTPWAPETSGRTGIGEELGVYEDLMRCVEPNEHVEYGVVEHRFAARSPNAYRQLLGQYGHTSLGPTKYSTSSFLSHALGQLGREGLLTVTNVKATGYWKYLRLVPAFSQPGTKPDIEPTSWATFAMQHGIAPESWPSSAA